MSQTHEKIIVLMHDIIHLSSGHLYHVFIMHCLKRGEAARRSRLSLDVITRSHL
jgi:hypothetical protein